MIKQNGEIENISQHGKAELGKQVSGMSYINENSFSRWIIEKSEGLTTISLQKLSDTV